MDSKFQLRTGNTVQRVYTTHKISKFCSVDITTVMAWIDDGKLPAYKTPGGHRRVLQPDLVEFLQRYRMPIPLELQKRGNRVLIVDDDPQIVQSISKILKRLDHTEIETATDGFEAGRKLETFLPDLVILDLMLPGMDGFQVCKNIRGSKKQQNVKILAITGQDTEENRKRIMSCGATAYMSKPLQGDGLTSKIAALLELSVPSKTDRE